MSIWYFSSQVVILVYTKIAFFKDKTVYWCSVKSSLVGGWINIKQTTGVTRIFSLLITKNVFISNIINIMMRSQHGSPWPSLATHLYHSSLLGCLQSYILYWHRTVVYRFYLVVLPLLFHVKGSTGVRRLRVRPHFPSIVRHVWFV